MRKHCSPILVDISRNFVSKNTKRTQQRADKMATILADNFKCIYYPWPFRPKGYCRFLRLSVCPSVCPSIRKLYLCSHDNSSQVWAGINKFGPNMHPGILPVGIENGGHWPWPSRSFWPFWLGILGNSVRPHDNSSQIWPRITKFAPSMHPGILSAGIENGCHWPWSSMSFWPFWLRILGNLACLHDNL